MKRRRPTLAEHAAAIFAERIPRRPPNFLEDALLAKIARALAERKRDVLAVLDRLREVAGLPQDRRVAFELKIERFKGELSSPRKGATA